MDALSESLRLPRRNHFWTPKNGPKPWFLTILASELLSRPSVVQTFGNSTSTNAPKPSSFNDFDFPIALARRRGAKFGDIVGSQSSAPARFWELTLCEPSKPQTMQKQIILHNSYPPSDTSALYCSSSIPFSLLTGLGRHPSISSEIRFLNFVWLSTPPKRRTRKPPHPQAINTLTFPSSFCLFLCNYVFLFCSFLFSVLFSPLDGSILFSGFLFPTLFLFSISLLSFSSIL